MKIRGTTLKEHLRKQLRDPEFRKAFNEEDLPARLAIRIAKLREAQGLTQQALSLLENPSSARYTLRTLQRVASALNRELVVQLK
jgi:DNA-binding Xre family transcriptional regulator